MAVEFPVVGHWYRHPNGNRFEVVAVDEPEGTIDLQYFDGTVDEIELESWPNLIIESIGAPEDWSGSVDMDPEDFTGDTVSEMPYGWHDPLQFLDQVD